jgi:hypothetical protein
MPWTFVQSLRGGHRSINPLQDEMSHSILSRLE